MKVLTSAVKTGNFSHAYIFCGPRGIGKTSVARIMAKAVNCKNADFRLHGSNTKGSKNNKWDGNPCNKCASCVSINNQTALDIIEIDAASNRGIDEIRDLREKVKFTPSELKYKVFIIDEVHMLTKEAFNALLKTLEEPPEHALFIMATTEIHKIPATVISRCQRFDFKRISQKELTARLEKIAKAECIKIDKPAIEKIAKASEGGLRDGVSILDQVSTNAGNKEIRDKDISELLGMVDSEKLEKLISLIENGDKKEALELLSILLQNGADIGLLAKGLMTLYRGKIKETIEIDKNTEQYVYAIEALSECNRNFKHALYPQLSLEIAILKIMGIKQPILPPDKHVDNATSANTTESQKTEYKKERKETSKKSSDENALENWSQVLFEIKSKNNSIHAFVRESEITVQGDEIHLVFPYKFHKERIEDRKNKKVVEKAISKVCGREFRVVCKLGKRHTSQENDTPAPTVENSNKKSTSIDEFLDVLGGEVVG